MDINLQSSELNGGIVEQIELGHWRLSIPQGQAGEYRLAQLDDYKILSRKEFPWQKPTKTSFKMRASGDDLPGTWGVGFWNDPLSLPLGLGGGLRRFPALPNAAWFFFASSHSSLSINDDLPANGQMAMSISSPKLPSWAIAIGSLFSPLLFIRPVAKIVRKIARKIVKQDTSEINHDPRQWHQYSILWENKKLNLSVNGSTVLETNILPNGPLGLVIWIDNQFAGYHPNGKINFGTLANPASWIEVKGLKVEFL
ncbi:MAG: hypothetical protein HON98_05930 [Chloroflexi bacterium]|jgi:hypothetical protein|nr:hypothetical protein [Chloroflexota bacterium]MBT3670566.1 hypothetical protein [Chloroflexota bacterium]MBT4002392.1 hypothetical protein [Chloroflexota bacterium]MBT4304201.1 hypothetical protein [Chloroflexota bacterium]MBT4533440.1 hypothetical protein [Chloroflexota bacterium]